MLLKISVAWACFFGWLLLVHIQRTSPRAKNNWLDYGEVLLWFTWVWSHLARAIALDHHEGIRVWFIANSGVQLGWGICVYRWRKIDHWELGDCFDSVLGHLSFANCYLYFGFGWLRELSGDASLSQIAAALIPITAYSEENISFKWAFDWIFRLPLFSLQYTEKADYNKIGQVERNYCPTAV